MLINLFSERLRSKSIKTTLCSCFHLHACHPSRSFPFAPILQMPQLWSSALLTGAFFTLQAPVSIVLQARLISGNVRWWLSRSWVVLHDALDLPLIGWAVLFEKVVGIGLCWGFGIRFIQQLLDAKEDLFDGNRWFPAFLLVQD